MTLPTRPRSLRAALLLSLCCGVLGAPSHVDSQTIAGIAGNGTFGYTGDGGAASAASLADPAAVFAATDGSLYIADTSNRRIRKVDAFGTISTVAGNGGSGYSGDGGPATDATLADPAGVFVDALGRIYIADTNNHRIRRVDPDGTIVTVAGDGNAGYGGDGGPATDARLNFPTGLFVDGAGAVFFADRENHRVRKVDPSGTISTVAGSGGFGFSGDGGPATLASLAFPSDVTLDEAGNVYVADRFNYRIRRVDAAGVIATVAGNGSFGFSGDGGAATDARLSFPSAVAVDAQGSLYIADRDNDRIRKVDASGTITTLAGDGETGYGGDDGPAVNASLNRPNGIRLDSQGNLYVADTSNRRIRKIIAPIRESTPASGPPGALTVAPGASVPIFTVGITGDGTSSVTSLRLTFSDLGEPTGLGQSDFRELRIYRSLDADLDALDARIEVYPGTALQIGAPTDLPVGGPSVPPGGVEWFYIVVVEMNTSAGDGHAFTVGFLAGGVATSSDLLGTPVQASDANRVMLDVVASRLIFTVQPASVVSGHSFAVQPVVAAADVHGNVDTDFAEAITLSEESPGTLSGRIAVAEDGVAVFGTLAYQALADQEALILSADDAPGGPEGDLPAVLSTQVVCDVMATQLVFATQPGVSISGAPFSSQPTVRALDGAGVLDTDFSDVVTLGHTGAGQLGGSVSTASAGVATFSSLIYTAAIDGEAFALTADDEPGGPEGDLPTGTSASTTSDVVATRLSFVVQPVGAVSGQALATAPEVAATDQAGVVDLDFTEAVTLTSSGSGSLSNAVSTAVEGVAAFGSLAYRAGVDHESVTLMADDQAGGPEGDLPAGTSNAFETDVRASRLVFSVQPEGAGSGEPFLVPPVVSGVDGDGVVDADFSDTITLSVSGPGTIANGSRQAASGNASFAELSYQAVSDGETFTLTADDLPTGPEGNLPAVTSIQVRGDIVATRLEFLVQPGSVVSGKVMSTQPVVVARGANGIVDVDFSEQVTLTVVGQGEVRSNTLSAVAGVAAFTDVAYLAPVDGTAYALAADDEPGGAEGDLASVLSGVVASNVIATRLVFAIQPSGSVSGKALETLPVVVAHDAEGILDVDFAETLTIRSGGAGTVANGSAQATRGVAVFTGLIYNATTDHESFTLRVDDQPGGLEGDLPEGVSQSLGSDVLATRLVFSTQPAGAISGVPLLSQPEVSAQDARGVVDTDFSDSVALTTAAPGLLTFNVASAQGGIARFTSLTYTATRNLETFTLMADDEAAGAEGDLGRAESLPVTAGSGEPVRLRISMSAEPLPADGASIRAVTVEVTDADGNVSLLDNATAVTLTISGAAEGGGTQIVRDGKALFAVTATRRPGEVLLRATGGGLVEANGSLLVTAGPAHRLLLLYDDTALPADGQTRREITVQVVDAAGNVRTQDDTSMVSLAVSGVGSGGGELRAAMGEATFSVTADTVSGFMHLSAASEGLPAVEGQLMVGFVPSDLSVADAPLGPREVRHAGEYVVVCRVSNTGEGPASGGFSISAYLAGPSDSIRVAEHQVTEALDAGVSLTVGVAFTLPSFSFSELGQLLHWTVVLDEDNALVEADETNNARAGNDVRYPQVATDLDSLDFGSVRLGERDTLYLEVSNAGLAPLSFATDSSDSGITVSPDSVQGLRAGEGRVLTVVYVARGIDGPSGHLLISSDDPRGGLLIPFAGSVEVPERVVLDLDLAAGDQGLRDLQLDANQSFGLELHLKDAPEVQAVGVLLEYDPSKIMLIRSTWQPGTFFGSEQVGFEEIELYSGGLELSAGTVGGGTAGGGGYLGRVDLATTAAFTAVDGPEETVVRAVRIRYLRSDGTQDSLQIRTSVVIGSREPIWPDMDGNGQVDFGDYLLFLRAYKQDATSPGWDQELPDRPFPQTPYQRYDIDNDGRIGFFDFISFTQAYSDAAGGSGSAGTRAARRTE